MPENKVILGLSCALVLSLAACSQGLNTEDRALLTETHSMAEAAKAAATQAAADAQAARADAEKAAKAAADAAAAAEKSDKIFIEQQQK